MRYARRIPLPRLAQFVRPSRAFISIQLILACSTQAAWGRTSYDPTILADPARARRPYCNQAELGVLVRLAGNTLAEIEACAEKFLPYQRPLVRFGKGDKLYIPPKAKILRGKGHSDSEGDAVRVERVGAYTSM